MKKCKNVLKAEQDLEARLAVGQGFKPYKNKAKPSRSRYPELVNLDFVTPYFTASTPNKFP